MRKETKNLKINKDTFEALEKYKLEHGVSTYNDAVNKLLGKKVVTKEPKFPFHDTVPRFALEVILIEGLVSNPYSKRDDIVSYIATRLRELGWDKAKPEFVLNRTWRAPLVTAIDNCIWRLFQNDIIEQGKPQSFDSIWSKQESGSAKQYIVAQEYYDVLSKDIPNPTNALIELIMPNVLLKAHHPYQRRLKAEDLLDR